MKKRSSEGVVGVRPDLRRWWIALLVLVLTGLISKIALDVRFDNAREQHAQMMANRKAAGKAEYRRIIDLLGQQPTREELEAALNLDEPLEITQQGPSLTAEYTSPLGAEFSFTFDATTEKIIGHHGHFSSSRVPTAKPAPTRYAIEELIGRLSRLMVPVMGNIFMPLFLIPLLGIFIWSRFPHVNRQWADFCLVGFAAICCLILAMDPQHRLGSMSNDRLFWGVLFLAAAVAVAVYDRLNRPRDPRLCVNCQYDLTGNTSGACPECGRAIPASVRAKLARL